MLAGSRGASLLNKVVQGARLLVGRLMLVLNSYCSAYVNYSSPDM